MSSELEVLDYKDVNIGVEVVVDVVKVIVDGVVDGVVDVVVDVVVVVGGRCGVHHVRPFTFFCK